ncbi:hypothetical protein LTR39_001580 [Cryomyces antarcticus]|nr:hypothetical protein LTR39_001580 [Cryomyces antarcticus]
METEATHEERQASTITDGERASFARLFDMMVANSAEPEVPKSQEKRKEPRKAAQALDGLDDLLDNAVRRAKREPPHLTRPKSFIHKLPRSLQDMAASAAELAQQRRNAFEEAIAMERDPHDPMKLRQDEDYRKVEGLLVAAQTDLELWSVLEDNVFARIRKLDLDNENPVKSRKGRVSDGKCGPAMGAVWEMSRFRRGLKKMDTWRGVVRERLEADAIRKANEQLAETDEAQQNDYSQA